MAVTPAKTSQPRLPSDTPEPQPRMSFGEHLEELRKRLFVAAAGAAIAIGFCLYYSSTIIAVLVAPYRHALRNGGFSDTFLNTGPAEVILMYLSVGFKAGIILAAPWIIYQVWLFVAAGLFQRERRIVYRYIGPSVALFLLGVAFFYFIVLPLTLGFFVDFTRHTGNVPLPELPSIHDKFLENSRPHGLSEEQIKKLPAGDAVLPAHIPVVTSDPPSPATQPADGQMELWYNLSQRRLKARIGADTLTFVTGQQDSMFTPFPKLDEYLHFVTFMALTFGGSFDLPMVMLVIAQIGVIRVKTFRRMRKYAYFIIAIAAAILAPSADVLSMISLMIPLLVLYEAGIGVSALLVRQPPEEPEEPESA